MRALFFLEPLLVHNRPFHYWAWLGYYSSMMLLLRASGWEVRVIVNEGLALRATAPRFVGPSVSKLGRGIPVDEVIVLEQEAIRRHFGAPNLTIIEDLYRGRAAHAALAGYAALVREALGDFVPDVVVTLTPADQLRAAFPDALVLSSENGAYSRKPFPLCYFFDPGGHWARSIPAVHAAALLERDPAPDELALLAAFRARFGSYLDAMSPFAGLVAELREVCPRVGLLPLQFGGEPGFDCNAPFRTQGEYLFHVIEQLPDDVGLLVCEHPTAHWLGDVIDEETRELLALRYPNVGFVDHRLVDSAGTVLLRDVDFAIAVSSSIGLQALFFQKPLVAVGTSHLAAFAALRGMEQLRSAADVPAHDPRIDRVLGWLMTHYYVPYEICHRPGWMSSFLERKVEHHRAGRLGLDFYEPIASADELAAVSFRELDRLAQEKVRARIANGNFGRWSRGRGPFPVGRDGPDAWHLLDFEGGVATVELGAGPGGRAAASIRRERAGGGPTFFLQRVPDVTSCAGSPVRLRFSARSAERVTIMAYLYLQIEDGHPNAGTTAQPCVLSPEWQSFVHVAIVPSIGARRPGPKSHIEVVFMLPAHAGPATFEVTDVALEAPQF